MPVTAADFCKKEFVRKVKNMGTHVIFVRHGQSDANVNKYFAGHTNAPLTAVGISQAEKMAEYLRKYPISAVYASDLSRAYYTAKPIADIDIFDMFSSFRCSSCVCRTGTSGVVGITEGKPRICGRCQQSSLAQAGMAAHYSAA